MADANSCLHCEIGALIARRGKSFGRNDMLKITEVLGDIINNAPSPTIRDLLMVEIMGDLCQRFEHIQRGEYKSGHEVLKLVTRTQ